MEIPTDRDVHRMIIRVKPEDIDGLNHVNNVVYVQWVQDVASSHWEQAASPELKEQSMWVVLRHEINYQLPAFSGDVIEALTWIEQPTGPRQNRFVVMRRDADGRTLSTACTTWCLLDPKSGRPKRISEQITKALGLP